MLNDSWMFLVLSKGSSYSDDFSGATSMQWLANRTYWDDELKPASNYGLYTYNYSGDFVVCSSGAADQSSYYNRTVTFNQYSQITAENVPTGSTYIGPSVRNKGTGLGNFYAWYSDEGASYFFAYDNGVYRLLDTGAAFTTGDVIRLEINSSTLSFYKNGSLDITMGTSGKYSDPSAYLHAAGYPGICSYGSDVTWRIDNWTGGSI